jgi:hypothetical protein
MGKTVKQEGEFFDGFPLPAFAKTSFAGMTILAFMVDEVMQAPAKGIQTIKQGDCRCMRMIRKNYPVCFRLA